MEFEALKQGILEAGGQDGDLAKELGINTDEASVDDISDGDMEKIRKLMENLQGQFNSNNANPSEISERVMGIHWGIYLMAFIIFFGIVGFFSYKLVQSLKEKERRKEEKKRLKELKKKK